MKKPKETLKPYVVSVAYSQFSSGTVIIKALNREHAEELAEDIDSGDVFDLEPQDGQLEVTDVSRISAVQLKQRRKEERAARSKERVELAAPNMLVTLKAIYNDCRKALADEMDISSDDLLRCIHDACEEEIAATKAVKP